MSEVLVEQLIQEDLNSKLPVLLKQFPEFDEHFIRQVAEGADPTGNRAMYVTWLLRMLRNQQWEITDAGDMREMLSQFDRLKRVEGFVGPTDINSYETIEAFTQALRENESLKSKTEQAKERGITGAKKLHEAGNLALWELTTAEAATIFGRGKGGLENPSTIWCTKDPHHSNGTYLPSGPLYTVTKDGDAYVQFHFFRKEAKNARNIPVKPPLATEIAPVTSFLADEFERQGFQYAPGGYFLTDERIEEYLDTRMKSKFIAQRMHGFYKDGIWHAPVKEMAVLEARWVKARPYFHQELVNARTNNDTELIKQAGVRVPEPDGIQAVYNAVYEFTHAKPT